MRVRHRWLLLAVFVVAIVIVLAVVVVSTRGPDSRVTVSFLGFTNLPNATVRSAIFVVSNEDRTVHGVGRMFVEAEGLEDHKPSSIAGFYRPFDLLRSGWGSSNLFVVDEPLQSGRWRASYEGSHNRIELKLWFFAAKHRLLSRHSLLVLSHQDGLGKPSSFFTNSSIWLTNSHSAQKQP